ncbi:MAG: protoporphyrinogen oxidase [Magnetococcales bacterium]|nr:protoporphyrinogen oxidase [Magnetococcales bacterium]
MGSNNGSTPGFDPASVLIIGGGISGLATAWFLHQHGVKVTVLESRKSVGGALLTSRSDHWLVEHGPNSTLQKPGRPEDALGRLVEQLGLEERLLTANESANIRYVVRDGRLQALPTSPPAFLKTPVFSWRAKLRLLAEPFIKPGREEESIATFVRRRLGEEFLNYAIEPFISGVYAGNPRELSVRAAVPRIHELEQNHGSLIRGAMALGKAHKQTGMPKGRMISFKEGLEELPRAIVKALPEGSVRTGTLVTGVQPDPSGGWRVTWKESHSHTEGSHRAGRVVLAVPAPAAAGMVRDLSATASRLLGEIPYAPIVSMALGFERSAIRHTLNGFGFLIPRKEGIRTLGALFSSTLFPGRSDDRHALITAFIGGSMDASILDDDDTLLVRQVRRDLDRCLGIDAPPSFIRITRYTSAIPQYTMGHLERIRALDSALAETPGLTFRCNWREGISMADCVKNAEATADALME